jgi:hypothetical protein
MVSKSNQPGKKSANQPIAPQEESTEGASRPTFYMSTEIVEAIEAQSDIEGVKRSPFVAELLEFLLLSPIGIKLRESAQERRRRLMDELQLNLVLFSDRLPTDKIIELAKASQRDPDQMLVYMVLMGLRVYERSLNRMDAEIEVSSEHP